jgi:SAM-dependent methyltransferase
VRGVAVEPDDGGEDEWERHAQWWIDGFTEGADAEYAELIVPLLAAELAGARRVLDVGSGEGQIARRAAAGGASAIGLDATQTLLDAARARGGGVAYVRASATALPFADAAVDAAVVCLVLEHLDDLEAAVAELSRVIQPGGRLCCVLNHPLIQTPGSGLIEDHTLDPPERYWRVGPYLVEHVGAEEVDHGVHVNFVHRPLSRYVNAFAEAGLAIERMVEPWPAAVAAPGPLAGAGDPWSLDAGQAAVPRLLYLRLRRG